MRNFSKVHKALRWLMAFILFCSIWPGLALAKDWHRLDAVLHLHSTYSYQGEVTPLEIVRRAREKGIEAVVFADDALVKVSYGFFPFRRLFKLSIEKNSVFKKGLSRYLQEIEGLGREYPGMVVLPGLEVAPFYYWERPPLTFRGVVRDWGKHLLVMGLDEEQFRSLPLIENRLLPLEPFEAKDLFRLWGILPFILGIFYFRRRAFAYRDEKGKALGPPSPFFRGLGIFLLIVGILSLIENFPYRQSSVGIYHPEGKNLPYQRLIEDIRKKGGLVFWAHPEATMIPQTVGPAIFLTDPYPEALLVTKGYTGFAILFEGMKTIGIPGGIWDQLLNDYCQGRRKKPIWAIGELEYTSEGRANTFIDTVKTILFCHEKDREGILEALRNGRMYVMRRSRTKEMVLKEFWVGDTETRGFFGEEVILSGNPRIGFEIAFSDGSVDELRVRMIRNGEVIRELNLQTPISFLHEDTVVDRKGKIFYRLEVVGNPEQVLLTNPVFVSFSSREGGKKDETAK